MLFFRMMKLRVLFLVLLAYPVKMSFIRENVVFKKIKEITTTRARWLVAFEIGLTSYQTLITTLEEHLSDTANSVSEELLKYWQQERRDPSRYLRYKNTISILKHEISNLNLAQTFLLNELKDIKSLQEIKPKRGKRVLIPIVGKALSFLFGLISSENLESIQNNINKLAENQKHITHVLSESLSVMKLSQGQITENRKSINQIINNLNNVKNFSLELSQDVRDLDNFVRLYAKFDRSLTKHMIL